MKGKSFISLLAIPVLAVSAVACSDSGGDEAKGTTQPAETGGTSTPAKTQDISFLNFAYTIFPDPNSKGVEAIKQKFNANIKPQFVLQSDFNEKLNVIMASGDMPDVVAIKDLDANYYKWAKQGAFLPLDEYIDKYPTLKAVPTTIYDQFRINGKIYSVPMYSPTYTFSGTIRQDWLDNLGLKMPTSYKELLEVAAAFTTGDPDKNGKNDTYGFALGQDISPTHAQGAYWNTGWYHKDKDGNYIPGMIGPGRKEVIETLAAAYKQGAVTKDFAVLNWAQTNKEFYSGKAGIFIGTPTGMVEDYYLGLLQVNPTAKVAPIPFFIAPDGSQGNLKGRGFFGLTTLSAKLKDDPDKVNKILEILDYGRQFIPVNERTDKNEQFDWIMGGKGVGYDMADGKAVPKAGQESSTPIQYMLQRHEFWKPWAPSDEANQYSIASYNSKEMQAFIATIEEMEKQYNKTPYDDPSYLVYSETQASKGTELNKYLLGEQTKMISGHRPIAEWDKMVQEWKDRGGQQLIKEINDGIKAAGK
ncbi:extracellular solute-binding protein [Paenibacillus nasutitermitis]|uniref:Lipoprotein LipO n=1 Tax=Paenibacillus nasutitermitis TaxID=1652958 RepID=A0A916ZDR7_9BACL|nr:extracellular solute-binding protein [Paenibacillus nasutitermitis]GGD88635.1 lipoprotein LipO [Paenibacillus nasutitermitis]